MVANIRKATAGDLESIILLNTKLRQKDYEEYDLTIDVDFPSSEEGRKYFTERIGGEDSIALVAEDDGAVVGYFVGGLVAPEAYRNITKIAEGENMFIDDGYQGSGIGTAFFKLFDDWCKERGVERMRVIASAENKVAIEFYKKVGFRKYDITLEKDI